MQAGRFTGRGLFGFQDALELELYFKPTRNCMLWVFLYTAGAIVCHGSTLQVHVDLQSILPRSATNSADWCVILGFGFVQVLWSVSLSEHRVHVNLKPKLLSLHR